MYKYVKISKWNVFAITILFLHSIHSESKNVFPVTQNDEFVFKNGRSYIIATQIYPNFSSKFLKFSSAELILFSIVNYPFSFSFPYSGVNRDFGKKVKNAVFHLARKENAYIFQTSNALLWNETLFQPKWSNFHKTELNKIELQKDFSKEYPFP